MKHELSPRCTLIRAVARGKAADIDRPTWKHWLTIVKPDGTKRDTAFLFIGGGSNRDKMPEKANERTTQLALDTGTIVAELGTVEAAPKQDGRNMIMVLAPDELQSAIESAPMSGRPPGPHTVEGVAPGFIPPHMKDRPYSEARAILEQDGREMARRLAREEGLFVGISSGAAAVAALRIAKELDQGVIVTLFPDAGYKYLSDKSLWSAE